MLLFGGCPGHCQMVSIIPGLYARYPPPIVITRNDDTGCPVSSAGGPQTPPRMPVVLLGGQRGPVREFSSESVSSVWILFIWIGTEAQEQPTSLWWALGSLPLHHLFFWAPPLPCGLPTGYFVSGYFQSPSPNPLPGGLGGGSHRKRLERTAQVSGPPDGNAAVPRHLKALLPIPITRERGERLHLSDGDGT